MAQDKADHQKDQESRSHQLPWASEKQPPLSGYEIDERAADAQALLDSPLFIQAIGEVYSRAAGTLLNADVGSLTAGAAHATMKAVRDIYKQLEQYITDNKMHQRFGK